MDKLNDRIPIPPKDKMNMGLSSAGEQTMLKKFGRPGELTKDCSAATGKIKKRLVSSVDVGPFKVSGLDFAVESLRQIFAEAQTSMVASKYSAYLKRFYLKKKGEKGAGKSAERGAEQEKECYLRVAARPEEGRDLSARARNTFGLGLFVERLFTINPSPVGTVRHQSPQFTWTNPG